MKKNDAPMIYLCIVCGAVVVTCCVELCKMLSNEYDIKKIISNVNLLASNNNQGDYNEFGLYCPSIEDYEQLETMNYTNIIGMESCYKTKSGSTNACLLLHYYKINVNDNMEYHTCEFTEELYDYLINVNDTNYFDWDEYQAYLNNKNTELSLSISK